MNIIKFLDEFTTDNLIDGKTSRRDVFSKFGALSKKAAIAAVPFGLASVPKKALAQSMSADPVGALQLALTLEYLEDEFYDLALQSGVLPSGRPEIVYMQISKHEQAHVDFLRAGLEGAGVTPVEKPTFDFTVGGMFDPFNDNGVGQETAYAQLLALAQAFEDTGVRAYKGQAGNLLGSDFLTPALQIHSVEARHASEIRRLRGLKGWITNNDRGMGMPEATQAVYDGEENIVQGGVDVTTLGSDGPFTMEASSEAYDEPLSGDDATAIASLFIVN
ncbi:MULTISPECIES: ferritin-like domain-containing protein [Maribacter]|uniref:Ferritin-like domain-containing protein n=1 Tax=Maribacter flavus TaxID=1658664 RepID=A0A5B2TXD3_9FLAO|nr:MULTISPECIES: ferritin-like domain-containing protein [Maribacter]KAA2218300.1 ferritin-like domain-containing protein [Maribacter flavus]MDC6405011.1 ferritin-like domain-containing protein [Maribacter sp. PR66]MEE1972425.1 ferritin-like domain-containing protein [Maribacter flavus]